ncbi:MAG: acyl-ACP desaturase [Candidatus Hydrogenedentes bacterium]|nr:acyl-ACP desaturase [Candidatus Hydrogenedentota bacterium]
MYQFGSRLEVMKYLEPFLAAQLPYLLRKVESNWQPMDYSPDLSTEEGFEEVRALQEEARALPDDTMTVLVGDMITEEALPTYASWIATLEGVGVQGEPQTAWGAWNRGWCAEENRHGDILNRYLYLTGRVNMREVEITVQHLIADGGDTQTENDPYRTFIYTSFQEIATRISHLNVGKIAQQVGATRLFHLSRRVAGDEQRHAKAYKLFISKIMEVDTSEAVLAFQDMMKKKITMPAMYMRERGKQVGETFKKFEVIANRSGVYTPWHYVEIIENLLQDWDIQHLANLSPAATKAQEYLCNLPERYRKLIERLYRPKDEAEIVQFSWLLPPALKHTAAISV